MKTSFTFFGIIACFFVSCNSGSDQNNSSNSEEDLSISIDTVQISPRRSSQVGLYQWNGMEILYVDNLYGFVEGYSAEGEFLGTYLKIMNGPEELPGISQIGIHENGYLVKGEAWNFYLYDNEWNFVKKFFLNTSDGSSVADLMNMPNPKSQITLDV